MYVVVLYLFFHGNHERREMCMYRYVRQVLNGISNRTLGMFMYFCVQVCVHVFLYESIGVHTAPLGRDDPLLHQNYHYRPLSWLRLLTLDSCQNLSGRLPPHLVR